ncbi:hypothetical protein T06_1420 [Trichinella sp. T6]|nr:hypothetical protein T06_1420 [Trichinella sp. T6]
MRNECSILSKTCYGRHETVMLCFGFFCFHLSVDEKEFILSYFYKDGKMTGVLLSRFRCRSISFPADGQFY